VPRHFTVGVLLVFSLYGIWIAGTGIPAQLSPEIPNVLGPRAAAVLGMARWLLGSGILVLLYLAIRWMEHRLRVNQRPRWLVSIRSTAALMAVGFALAVLGLDLAFADMFPEWYSDTYVGLLDGDFSDRDTALAGVYVLIYAMGSAMWTYFFLLVVFLPFGVMASSSSLEERPASSAASAPAPAQEKSPLDRLESVLVLGEFVLLVNSMIQMVLENPLSALLSFAASAAGALLLWAFHVFRHRSRSRQA
jgi:hypothetical protein